MGQVQPTFLALENTYRALTSADMQFKPAVDSAGKSHTLSQSTIWHLKDHADRDMRRSAVENYADSYLAVKNTLTAGYSAYAQAQAFNARVRGYNSSLEASLDALNLPRSVFDTLISTFKANIPTWHRYWDVRRRALKLDSIYTYDIWCPLTDKRPQVPYSQAIDWISNGMAPLGEEYVGAMRRGLLEERWVDVYPGGRPKRTPLLCTATTIP
jgi:oligoendopeptidase F